MELITQRFAPSILELLALTVIFAVALSTPLSSGVLAVGFVAYCSVTIWFAKRRRQGRSQAG